MGGGRELPHTSVHLSRVGGRRSCGCGGFRRGRREELHTHLSVSQGWDVGINCGCGCFRRGRGGREVAHTSFCLSRLGGRRSCDCGGSQKVGGGRVVAHTHLSIAQGWEVGEVVAVVVSEGGGGR